MKRLIAFLFIVLVAFSAYSWWQITQLRQEVADLRSKLEVSQARASEDPVMAALAGQLARVQQAVAQTDPQKARQMIEDARKRAEELSQQAGEKAGPALAWFRQQAGDLEKRLQSRR